MKFSSKKGRKWPIKYLVIIFLAICLIALAAAGAYVKKSYDDGLKPLSTTSKSQIITIETGSTPEQVANLLEEKSVIRSSWVFEWYVRKNKLHSLMKAGSYQLDQNQTVPEIVSVLTEGKVATDLVTILPGKRLDQIRQGFIDQGFSSEEVDNALNPNTYSDHSLVKELPNGANLEGYLYPETFQKTAETKLVDIVKLSLDELDAKLTSDIRKGFTKQGLSLHQAITLASIVQNEVSGYDDRRQVAQVFIKRLNEGMKLESNATDQYAEIDPKYDTYKIDGLPPSPISNVGESSLKAVSDPSNTEWLFFVSGDDGKTYFSKTIAEHQKLIEQHCTTLCGR